MSDNRKHPRVICRARVDFGSQHEVFLDHQLENLSLGGACLRVNAVPDVNAPVFMTLTFPELDNATIELDGVVVWANLEEPRDIGVRFQTMTPQDREILRRYVQLHAR